MKKKYNSNNNNKDKFLKTLCWFIGLVIIVSGVWLTIETTTSGAEMARLSDQKLQLIQVQRKLSEDLVKSSSLNELELNSSQLGYIKPQNIVYITNKSEDVAAKLP